jgi:uncharacterized protein (UPF0332 family)
MTETLSAESRAGLVAYRLSRADQAILDAEFNASGSRYVIAVNRLYYACFYAASALLLSKGIEAATHKGVRTMINLHFVSKGLLEPCFGKTLNDLYEKRQSGDYDDYVFFDKDDYDRLHPRAIAFVAAIKPLIR